MSIGLHITKTACESLGVPAGFLCWAPNKHSTGLIKRRLVRVFDHAQPWKYRWVPRESLLPAYKAGRQCRGESGWFIMVPNRLFKGKPDAFIQDPWKAGLHRLGPVSWRFFSRGEAMYYLNCFPFPEPMRVNVCQVSDNVYAKVLGKRIKQCRRPEVLSPQVKRVKIRHKVEVPNH